MATNLTDAVALAKRVLAKHGICCDSACTRCPLARAVLAMAEVVEAADETLRRVTDWTSQQEEGDKLLDPWELRLKVAIDRLRARVEGGT